MAVRPSGRFPSSQHVRKRSEFREIQTNGRRVNTPHFVLLVYARSPVAELREARIGLTVSRKVGTAVVRNRAKRLLREAFRATRRLWDPDVDLVVIVRHMSPDLKLAAVVAELTQAERAIRRRVTEARRDRENRAAPLARAT